MKPHEVEAAACALDEFRKATKAAEALSPYDIVGVKLRRVDESYDGPPTGNDIPLHQGVFGSGSVNSIGYPTSLRRAISAALHKWAADRIEAARVACREAGVEIEE